MYIKVKATPSAKKESIEKTSEDTFVVCVKEPAKRNLANRKIVEKIADELMVPKGKIRIISGHHSRNKILSVDIK
jgi:uncharacterized protein YggU (UPF0235/DUF167 family)